MKPKTFQMHVKRTPYTEMKEVQSLGIYGGIFGVSKTYSKQYGDGYGVTYIPSGDRCGFSYSLARARDLARAYVREIPAKKLKSIGKSRKKAAVMLWPIFSKWKSEQASSVRESAHA